MADSQAQGADGPKNADDFYSRGIALKTQGRLDSALTEFRRAVLLNPSHGLAHFQIGLLCQQRAKLDPMFARLSLDAFRHAARLQPDSLDAHTYYVTMGQQFDLLDDILLEYQELAKKEPANKMFKKVEKNIIAISMALTPRQADVGGSTATKSLRKFLAIVSFVLVLIGFGLMTIPGIVKHKGGPVTAETLREFFKVGVVASLAGAAGIIGRAKM